MKVLLSSIIATLATITALNSTAAEYVSPQGWSDDEQTAWYETSQGSRLIPLLWLQALRIPGSDAKFLNDDHIRKLGYFPRDLLADVRLPRGFAVDVVNDSTYRDFQSLKYTKFAWKDPQLPNERWVGMTCAACHTTTITYKSTTLTIDGGPTMADFEGFLSDLSASLDDALNLRFDQFAKDVLGDDIGDHNKALLKSGLTQLIADQKALAALNASSLKAGFGRLDAVGHILNKAAFISGAKAPPVSPADGPVSYPFLWNTHQQDLLEWNGLVGAEPVLGSGLDIGALGRNTGEVIGVFADVAAVPHPGLRGYVSSAKVDQLIALENLLKKLKPPAWPETVFSDQAGSADPSVAAKIKAGGDLYSQYCESCHTRFDQRDDLDTKVAVRMVPLREIGTDPWMACNVRTYTAPTGVLEGETSPESGQPLGASDLLANTLGAAVKDTLLGQKVTIAENVGLGWLGVEPLPKPTPPQGLIAGTRRAFAVVSDFIFSSDKGRRLDSCKNDPDQLKAHLAYKGRPLHGIWATAPYLHNGSVPTLADLLLPTSLRPATFSVGSLEFDPVKVGFQSDPALGGFQFDTSLAGNSNAGHDGQAYGTLLNADDRAALIEYLKRL